MMLLKCCTQYASEIGKLSLIAPWPSRPQDWKGSVFIPIPKKGNAKECTNYRTIALNSHATKVMLKILQAWFQQYVNHELPDVQAGFRKSRGTRDQIANIHTIIGFGIVNKAEADAFLELSCFFYDPMDVQQFDLWFLCFF